MPSTGAAPVVVSVPVVVPADCDDCAAPVEIGCAWVERKLWSPQGEVIRRVRVCGAAETDQR